MLEAFRAPLNFRQFKVALIPTYMMLLNFKYTAISLGSIARVF